jgi:hypothetical protein
MLKDLREFLESEGGEKAIVISMQVWIVMIVVVMQVTGHQLKETGLVLATNSFTALFAVLLRSFKKI